MERCLNLDVVESAVQDAVTTESQSRAEAIDGLIAALLSAALGFTPRSTDGFVPLLEEIGIRRYFAVGKIFMIDDQSIHPVSLDLVFAFGAGIAAGTVRIGVTSGEAQFNRIENALLAYPHETAESIEWACTFDRRPDGWVSVGSLAEHS